MENLIFSINIAAPTFLTALLGYYLKKNGLFTDAFLKQADRYIFTVALPFLMIKDISSSDISQLFSFQFALLCILGTTFMFFGAWAICCPFVKDKKFVGAFAVSSARGSVAVFGASIAINIYGNAGVTPLMIALAVPLYNIYSVVLMSLNTKDGEKVFSLKNIKAILYNIVTNPLIIGIAIGICLSLFKFKVPAFLNKTISSVASTGTPLALLSLGASIQVADIFKRIKPALAACFLKLIGFGAVLIPIAVIMGFRDGHLVAILIMSTSPTPVTAYIMAKNMDNDHVFVSSTVMLSTILSAVTMTLWLAVLKSFALL